MRYPIALAAALLTGAAADLAAQGGFKDIVVATNGRRIRGVEVTAMTLESIKYRRGDQESELPANSLARVIWDSPPEEFALAAASAKRGEYENAANLYAEAVGKTERASLKQEAAFLAAQAAVAASEHNPSMAQPAVDRIRAALAAAPDGFRVPDLSLLLGKAQRLAGDPAGGEATLAELSQNVLAKNWAVVWDARAKFEKAKAQIAQGKVVDARTSFRAAISATEAVADADPNELSVIRSEAAVGEGETYVAEKKYDQALQYFRGLISREKDQAIVAAAKAGEGEALFLQAEAQAEQDNLRAAQIALAEANLLDPVGGATTAKALYYSGKVLLALGPDREQDAKARAKAYFATVVKSYPQTSWAAAAAAALDQ